MPATSDRPKTPLSCPACDRPLKPFSVGHITVDICRGGCGGIWFDQFELSHVDEVTESAGEFLLNIEAVLEGRREAGKKRCCPRCDGVKLMRHFFSARKQVEVDHCPNCGGYWLDAGELAKVREELAERAAHTQRPAKHVSTEVLRYIYEMRSRANASP